MVAKQFKKTKEDFACEHCGAFVQGTGYTNHCPACLWSKHVDVHPGDRASFCFGMMKPISVQAQGRNWKITHQCLRCGHKKSNKTSPEDNFDALVQLASTPSQNH